MKTNLLIAILLAGFAAGTLSLRAGDTNQLASTPPKGVNIKPYPLKTCVVSGDVLGGEMGKPVTNYYQGQQIIFCCKDCVTDFNQDPRKYLKKLAEEAAKAKK